MTKKRKRSDSLAFFSKEKSQYILDLTKKPDLSTFNLLYKKLEANTIKAIRLIGDIRGNYTPSVLKVIELAVQHAVAVEEIDLYGTLIGEEGITLLRELLTKSNALKKLVLSHTELTHQQISILNEGLMNNNTLTELDLGSNNITPTEMRILNTALEKNKTLSKLKLSYNFDIGDKGTEALLPALKKNGTLTVLGLRQCDISDTGLEHIIDALNNNPNSSIKELDLRDNELSEEGTDSARSFLKTNPSIKMHLFEYEEDNWAALRDSVTNSV